MLVRVTSHTGDMYENQFVYALKIRTAASSLLMLHALAVEKSGHVDKFHFRVLASAIGEPWTFVTISLARTYQDGQ